MNVDDNTAQDGHLIPHQMTAFGEYVDDDTASTTKARDWKDATDLVTFDLDRPTHTGTITSSWQKVGGSTQVDEGQIIGTLTTKADLAVRRLTPTECERLMGWPDGHTEPAGADSHRYRLCGNGVIAPAAEWIARRIDATEAQL